MSQVTFQGSNVGLLLKQAPLGQRVLGQAVKLRESTLGLSHLTFLQDTAVAWLPKTLISRSKAELSEATFLEFLESFLIYYGVPLTGGKIFNPLIRRIAKHTHPDFNPHVLTQSMAELSSKLSKEELAKVLPAKAAIILATLGAVVFGGEFVVSNAKNLMTSEVFKKDNFSDVVNLSQGKRQTHVESPVSQKARKRILQSAFMAAGTVASALLLARFGYRMPVLQKPLAKFVKTFDFEFSKEGMYRLSKAQMVTFMGFALLTYLDAARDKLERLEVAARLSLVLPYLAFGQEALEKLLIKTMGKRFPNVLDANGHPKTLEVLADEAMQRAKTQAGKLDEEQLLKLASQEMQTSLRVRNMLFAVPLLTGILVTGIGVGIMNRIWTAARFKNQRQTSLGESNRPTYQNPTAAPVQTANAFENTLFANENLIQPTNRFLQTLPLNSMPQPNVFAPFEAQFQNNTLGS